MAKHRRPSSKGRTAVKILGAAAVPGVASIALAAPSYASSYVQAAGQTVPHVAAMVAAHRFHEEHLAHEQHLRDMAAISVVADRQIAPPPVKPDVLSRGILSPGQIGALWLEAGGSPLEELTAECIAHFESGGNPDAISPTDDWGVWQINASHGPAMATLNPLGNAEAAVAISSDGTNWGAWTTAYHCV